MKMTAPSFDRVRLFSCEMSLYVLYFYPIICGPFVDTKIAKSFEILASFYTGAIKLTAAIYNYYDRTPCTGGGAESVGVASTPLIFTLSELLEWQTRGHNRSRAVENFVLLCRNNRYSDPLKGRPSIIDKPPHADRLSGGIVNSTG